MGWNYAALSKAAKAAGGPEKLVEKIAKESVTKGKLSMIPLIVFTAIASIAATICVPKAVNYFRKKRAVSEKALEEAKEELIQGIKDYDAEHPEEDEEAE